MLPDLRTEAGFAALREADYGLSGFDTPRQFKMQAEILDVAIITASALTNEPAIISDTAFLILDSLFKPPTKGFEFFPRYPKEEVAQFCRLAVASRENGLLIPVICPVCPDYPERGVAVIGDGIGYAARRVLDNLTGFFEFFRAKNLGINLQILVADVEVLNPIMLNHSGATAEEFLTKTQMTQAKIRAEIERMGMSGVVTVSSMAEVLTAAGWDYLARHRESFNAIQTNQTRMVNRVKKSLMQERQELRNFNGFVGEETEAAVTAELADYAVFGDFIDGQAVILSPDAMSAVPAYNFLRSGKDKKLVNPTIFLKNVKINHDRQNYY